MEKLVALARAEESTQLTEARREVGEAKAKLQEAAHGHSSLHTPMVLRADFGVALRVSRVCSQLIGCLCVWTGLVAAQSRVCELESAKSKLQTDLDSVKVSCWCLRAAALSQAHRVGCAPDPRAWTSCGGAGGGTRGCSGHPAP